MVNQIWSYVSSCLHAGTRLTKEVHKRNRNLQTPPKRVLKCNNNRYDLKRKKGKDYEVVFLSRILLIVNTYTYTTQ